MSENYNLYILKLHWFYDVVTHLYVYSLYQNITKHYWTLQLPINIKSYKIWDSSLYSVKVKMT